MISHESSVTYLLAVSHVVGRIHNLHFILLPLVLQQARQSLVREKQNCHEITFRILNLKRIIPIGKSLQSEKIQISSNSDNIQSLP